MLDANFPVVLKLSPGPVLVSDMTELEVGQVLPLSRPLDQPAVLTVANEEMFRAFPVRCGYFRGAQIHERLSISPASRRAVP